MLYKRGKTWWIDFTAPNGQRIRRSADTDDKVQAQELHDRLKSEAWRQVKLGERPSYTWDDAGLRWLDEKAHKASFADDVQRLNWLQSYFRGVLLTEMKKNIIMEVADLKRRETSPATANRYLALIRSILRQCVEWEWLDAALMLRAYPEAKRRVRWLLPEEAQRLLLELPAHLRDMAEFSLATGLRQANVKELEWSQINLFRGVAWIHPDQAKARKAIGVNLTPSAIAVLRRRLGEHHRYVFTYKDHPVTQVSGKAWWNALKRAGIENFRWHDLRHTWASWHIQAGTPLFKLQEMGGWESMEMVLKYAHLAPEHLAAEALNIETILAGLGTFTSQREKDLEENIS
ncbi:site-specific integrase [Acidithiobacillus ferriphilus]|jgi:Site-specific recombinase XerD|uniref:Integrase n=2 Tax=Acidithiobacillus TaxID=119977 RepID=A0A179BIX0_ACIFR|nr:MULTISPECIES: site-specific integrase [Acidithiobacillus]MBU2846077.1 site-specific integrase [Acidithiobacillus ferriphilus]MEB8474462.1 site-specific integrase [Acidithiobacillus ferriphilus]MEB8488361.1 site-specific integrase [Acidithiobacillus ferriphilus]MEB8488862.1 site-specific integrase [Acidithiobacillus ferriphilus]MEB8493581.1 site-specific integrase [Acidithiobacillus ferriphilus]